MPGGEKAGKSKGRLPALQTSNQRRVPDGVYGSARPRQGGTRSDIYNVPHARRLTYPRSDGRRYSLIDRLIAPLDQAARTLFGAPHATRPYPAEGIPETVEDPAGPTPGARH